MREYTFTSDFSCHVFSTEFRSIVKSSLGTHVVDEGVSSLLVPCSNTLIIFKVSR